ncbi:thiol-disulfide oxidoreductase DCC family protein [Lihuaxuella thermophila]|uniref:Predicted thiol-disulfide oxidoreductase YuxK, DCC family n=1 Tax=Lihuaxuella thermophila TaxID=1173111 RepID=A0A1H8C631_9BACL|nr:thiol-disulfide oxidoreductase DCC family protein [Lihuaxuella thermophila]SEM90535.1 Predicted thiol-disulfide oxidoreductase YuxK, DCC family [Lihuaxuella thermophila]
MSSPDHHQDGSFIILFDGVCNFCNEWVQFVIRRDSRAKFRFAPLQSDTGQSLLSARGIDPAGLDSLVLIEKNRHSTQSTAVLRICKELDGLWKVLYLLILVPRPLRNAVYRWVAANRYRWFGKRESCMIPTPEIRGRFLELDTQT